MSSYHASNDYLPRVKLVDTARQIMSRYRAKKYNYLPPSNNDKLPRVKLWVATTRQMITYRVSN